jgi:hypothetical protein
MLLATYAARLTEAWPTHNHFKIKGHNFKLLPVFYELWVTYTHAHTHTDAHVHAHTHLFTYYTDA